MGKIYVFNRSVVLLYKTCHDEECCDDVLNQRLAQWSQNKT